MPDFTDPLTDQAEATPGEMGTAVQWNTYALNNVEAVATAVGDTVAELEDHWGGASVAQRSGRFGDIRVGGSTYEHLHIVYDEDTSRWVSQTFSWGSSGDNANEGSVGTHMGYILRRTASGASYFWGPLIPWGIFDTAGLQPQFRWLWVVENGTASQNWTVNRVIQGIDIGDTFSTTGVGIGSPASGTQNSPTLQGDSETAWLTSPIGTVTDYICPGIQLETDVIPSNTTSTLWQATFLWRWVSS